MNNINYLFKSILRIIIILLLFSMNISCGGGGGNNISEAASPWESAGEVFVPDGNAIEERVRSIEFEDGLIISYDGTDNNDEEVCRKQQEGERIFSICMGLDLQVSSISTEELALNNNDIFNENSSVDISCKIDNITADCNTDVFPSIGNNFECEFGVVNGDKALKCSDDWAVVVNGEESESKTICRVHLSDNSGYCLGAPKQDEDGKDIPPKELILKMQKTSWDGYKNLNVANHNQLLPGANINPQDLNAAPNDIKLSYKSLDESICTVDNDENNNGSKGNLSIDNGINNFPSICKIILTIQSEGYVDRVIETEVEVVRENDTNWLGYDTSSNFYVGEDRIAIGTTGSVSPLTLSYKSLDESICTVDKNTGVVTAVSARECKIRLEIKSQGFLDLEIERNITILNIQQFQSIIWNDFPASAIVGVETGILSSPVSLPAADNYIINVSTMEVCSWDYTKKVLSFSFTTSCIVTVTAQKRGYDNFVQSFSVAPSLGTQQGLDWNPMGAGEVGVSLVLEKVSGTTGDVKIYYTVVDKGNTECEFSQGTEELTRTLTFKDAGTCQVKATIKKRGYTDGNLEGSIIVSKGTLGTINWGVFQGTLVIGGATKIPSSPTGAGLVGTTISYAVKSSTNENCELISSLTGEVRAKVVSFPSSKSCIVIATVRRSGYNSKTNEISINLQAGIMGTLVGQAYSDNLAVGGEPIAVTTQPSVATEGATWTYFSVGKRGTSQRSDICSVNTLSGKVSVESGAQVGDTCEVIATAEAIGYQNKSAEPVIITIVAGVIKVSSWGSYGIVTVGLSTVAPTLTSVIPDGVEKTYTIADGSSGCTVDEDSGAVIGVDNGINNCKIKLTLSKENYESLSYVYTNISVLGVMGTLYAPVYQGFIVIEEDALEVKTTPSGAPEGATWIYSIIGKRNGIEINNICLVDSNGAVSAGADAKGGDVCEVTATARVVGYRDKSAPISIVEIRKRAKLKWEGYNNLNPRLSDNSPELISPVVENKDQGDSFSYTYSVHADTTKNSCRVHSSTGILTLDHAGTCVIEVQAIASGYITNKKTKTIAIRKGVQSPPYWGGSISQHYSDTFTLGITYPIKLNPQGGGGHGNLKYSSGGSNCIVDEGNGAVTIVKEGISCVLTVKWSGNDDYEESSASFFTIIFTHIRPNFIEVDDWGNYKFSRLNLPAISAPALTGVTPSNIKKTYALANGSSGCTVDEDSGTVAGTTLGINNCKVELTLSKKFYRSKKYIYTISVITPTEIGVVDWGDYEKARLDQTISAPSIERIDPAGVNKTYTLANGSSGCTVDEDSGDVTGTTLGINNCKILVTLSKENYVDKTHTYILSVGRSVMGDLTPPTYGRLFHNCNDCINDDGTFDENYTGTTISVVSGPSGAPEGAIYVYQVSTITEISEVTGNAGTCKIDATSGALTILPYTNIGWKCRVYVTAKLSGYEHKTVYTDITIVEQ